MHECGTKTKRKLGAESIIVGYATSNYLAKPIHLVWYEARKTTQDFTYL